MKKGEERLMGVMKTAVLGIMAAMAITANAQTSTIQGSVLDVQGKPMSADVVAYRLAVAHGDIEPRAVCFTVVGNTGRFKCSRLEDGAYVLLFSFRQPSPKPVVKQMPISINPAPTLKTSYAELSATPRIGDVPLVALYPTLSDWRLSNLLHVRKNDTQFVSVTVDNDADSILEDTPALGVATGQVQLFGAGEGFAIPMNIQARVNPEDGNYLWEGLPAGAYKIKEYWGVGKISINARRDITLGSASTLRTSLAGLLGYPLEGAIETKGSLHSPSGIVFINQAANPPERYTARVTEDGKFQLNNLPAGSYNVAFPLSSRASVSALTINGASASGGVVYVNDSLSNSSILIGARPGTGSIAGSLRLNGSEQDPGIVIQSVLTGTGIAVPVRSNGFFRVSSLPTGQYLITGWGDLSRVPYNSTAFLAHYRDESASVNVDGDSNDKDIDVSCNNSNL